MVVREPRVQPPALDAYSDRPLFNTKAVVHQTGVPAPTLRAWERRYGILSPQRGENDYRLYSERDMMLVAWLRERVDSGMTISQAIALLRTLEPVRRRGRRGRATVALDAVSAAPPPALRPQQYSFDEMAAALLSQFVALDERAAMHTIAQALAIHPLDDVCLSLFTPVLEEVGRRWSQGEMPIVVEHFSSALIRAQLESIFRAMPAAERGPLVVVGCAPGNLHELGALMLALFLRRSGVRVAYLGQNCDSHTFVDNVMLLRPACVMLSASLASQVDGLGEIGRRLRTITQPRPLFCFGGQAFAEAPELAEAIPGEYLAGDARDAVEGIKQKLST